MTDALCGQEKEDNSSTQEKNARTHLLKKSRIKSHLGEKNEVLRQKSVSQGSSLCRMTWAGAPCMEAKAELSLMLERLSGGLRPTLAKRVLVFS